MARLTSAAPSWLRSTNASQASRPSSVRISVCELQRLRQQPHHLTDQVVDIGPAGLQRLLARECQQARGELRAAIGGIADQLGDPGKLRVVLDAVGEDFDGPGDHRQHVVEVVRDAAGQAPQRFRLLRLDQLFFGDPPLGDVPDERIDDVTVAAAQRVQRNLGEELVAVAMHRFGFIAHAHTAGRGLLKEAGDPLAVRKAKLLREHQFHHPLTDRLGAGPAGQRLGLRTPVQHDAVLVGLDESIERGPDDGLRHLLALDQRLMRAPLRGDVMQHRNGAAQMARLVAQRAGVDDEADILGRRLGPDVQFEIIDALAAQRAHQWRFRNRHRSSCRRRNSM